MHCVTTKINPQMIFHTVLRCQFSQFISSYQPFTWCSIHYERHFSSQIHSGSVRKWSSLFESIKTPVLYRYTFQDNFLAGLPCRIEVKKLNFMQENFICMINKRPFPLKNLPTGKQGCFTVW